MKPLLLLAVLLTFFHCKTVATKDVILRQLTSDKEVVIKPDIYSDTRDSLQVAIPLEFVIYNRSDKAYDFLDLDLIYNGNYISTADDFSITDMHDKRISRFDMSLKAGDSMRVVLRTRSTYTSKSEVQEIFKKYSVEKDVEKFRDSVTLVSYRELRRDFPQIVKNLEKIADSVSITTSNKQEKVFTSKKYKIKW